MLETNKLTVSFGKEILFEDVSLKFTKGNSYGIIGANGSGKSTLLKVLAKEIEPSNDTAYSQSNTKIRPVYIYDYIEINKRLSFLKQDQNAYNEYNLVNTVIMGNKRLYDVMTLKNEIYLKEDFTEKDGIKAGKLEEEFDQLNGWDAEYDAEKLLNALGVDRKSGRVGKEYRCGLTRE